MKNLAKIVFVTVCLLGAAPAALAQGFYAAIDAGQTKGSDVCTGAGGLGVVGCSDTATAWRLAGGYQIDQNWGGEISYGDYGSANLGLCTNTGRCGLLGLAGRPPGNWKASGYEIAGTGTIPIGEAGFAVFGKVGIAVTKFDIGIASATSTKLAFGIGAKAEISKRLAVRAQYENLGNVGDPNTTGKSKVTLLTGGLVMNF